MIWRSRSLDLGEGLSLGGAVVARFAMVGRCDAHAAAQRQRSRKDRGREQSVKFHHVLAPYLLFLLPFRPRPSGLPKSRTAQERFLSRAARAKFFPEPFRTGFISPTQRWIDPYRDGWTRSCGEGASRPPTRILCVGFRPAHRPGLEQRRKHVISAGTIPSVLDGMSDLSRGETDRLASRLSWRGGLCRARAGTCRCRGRAGGRRRLGRRRFHP